MNQLLNQFVKACKPYTKHGHVATYIPQLATADPEALGVCIVQDGKEIGFAGDYTVLFTMQSVVKPIILLQALMDSGIEKVRSLVGVEATGKPFDAFNYSDQALTGAHINPMINTGAIALCTLIHGESYAEKFARLLAMTRMLAENPTLDIDPAVYRSECETGNKNRALGYMLKAYGMVSDPVDDILDCYVKAWLTVGIWQKSPVSLHITDKIPLRRNSFSRKNMPAMSTLPLPPAECTTVPAHLR